MTYVFSMTSRMVAIAVSCAVVLCALLFLMGMEIGARLAHPAPAAAPMQMPAQQPVPESDQMPAQAQTSAPGAVAEVATVASPPKIQ
ncbi:MULTISPECIES: hypothetical protein [Cupriavidus]|uniref:Uncharacterized protein n=1 Tax=Cupriavidus pinatubonensis (strain JMP 134 / LMG 1197) TaxID=264198 RepID=Q470U5_CUPPJ|nr:MULTISPECIES: hypothetical protein [Cupriavidus]QYY33527.1 hypothetical protein K2O51_21355 [Cupriavidus pinatubonensis]TPQ36873.1 hypothetical protein C2U69_17685 [Cupriavidus pinatubonensis]